MEVFLDGFFVEETPKTNLVNEEWDFGAKNWIFERYMRWCLRNRMCWYGLNFIICIKSLKKEKKKKKNECEGGGRGR